MSLAIILTVLWKTVSSTFFWLVHLSIKFYSDWVIFISRTNLLIVFTLYTNTDFIRMSFHQLAKFSINLTALFITIWNGKERKKCYLCSNQKLTSTQTIGSVFLKRVRKVQNSKHEHDSLKVFDCFIDGYGFVNSDYVNFLMTNSW